MPTPTATIFLPYHALDDVILRGPRAAQPAASAVVAGTLYGVTDEGNLVERSTGTVWQAYSPTGGGGAPSAHHATHEPGGSDPLAVDAVAATGSLRTLGTGATQAAPGNDARFAAGTAAHHASHEPGGADALVNAAWTDRANVFTGSPQQIGPVANPMLPLYDSAQPADARVFRIMNAFQSFGVHALNDAQTVVLGEPLVLTRTGDALIGRDLYEKGRATPLGHWIDIAFTAANFTASPGTWTVPSAATFAYMLIGKTLWLTLRVTSSTIGGTPAGLLVALPPGFTIARVTTGNVLLNLGGSAENGLTVAESGNQVIVYRQTMGPFAAGAARVDFTIPVSIT